jgi:hypothetical protein
MRSTRATCHAHLRRVQPTAGCSNSSWQGRGTPMLQRARREGQKRVRPGVHRGCRGARTHAHTRARAHTHTHTHTHTTRVGRRCAHTRRGARATAASQSLPRAFLAAHTRCAPRNHTASRTCCCLLLPSIGRSVANANQSNRLSIIFSRSFAPSRPLVSDAHLPALRDHAGPPRPSASTLTIHQLSPGGGPSTHVSRGARRCGGLLHTAVNGQQDQYEVPRRQQPRQVRTPRLGGAS